MIVTQLVEDPRALQLSNNRYPGSNSSLGIPDCLQEIGGGEGKGCSLSTPLTRAATDADPRPSQSADGRKPFSSKSALISVVLQGQDYHTLSDHL